MNDNDFRLSLIGEFQRGIEENQNKEEKSNSTRCKTPMFLRKDRMEKAYKKHLERFKKGKKNNDSSKTPRRDTEENNSNKNKIQASTKHNQIHRNFMSFGSKVATTPSTSKRSSNDVDNKNSFKNTLKNTKDLTKEVLKQQKVNKTYKNSGNL